MNDLTVIAPEGYDLDHPWTRQPCDQERQWRGFLAFRDGSRPRTLLDVARATGEPLRELRKWYVENGWELRVLTYDQWVDVNRSQQVAAIIGEDAATRAARHIALLRGMQEIVGATVRDWLRRVSVGEIVIEHPREVIRAIKDMVTLERLVAGETTSHENHSGKISLGGLSVEELETLKALQDKASSGSG
jgi:hypothetical protein